MFDLMKGGYDHDVESDFLKNKPHLEALENVETEKKPVKEIENQDNIKFKIRKTASKYTTETRDNFRRFVLSPDEEQYMIDYLEVEENKGKTIEGEQNHYVTTYLKDFAKMSLSLSPRRNDEAKLKEEEEE